MPFPKLDFASIIRLTLLLACFVMSCAGTARPQYTNGDTSYYLWKLQIGYWSISFEHTTCHAFRERMRAAFAFAVLACIALGVSMLGTAVIVFSHFAPVLKTFSRRLRFVTLGLSIFAFVGLLIAWAISVNSRLATYCNVGASLADNGYGIKEGIALLVTSWVLMLFDVVLGVVGLILNRDNIDEAPQKSEFV